MKRQVQGPQSVGSDHREGNEHVTHSGHKDSKGRGKPDPSPPPSPVQPPLKSLSGAGSRGQEKRRASNGLTVIHSQATPKPGDTFSVLGEKQMSDVDDKDDTMELLKGADMENPGVEVEKERRSAHKPDLENIGKVLGVNMDNKNDTVTLLKGTPTQQHTSDIQVSALSNRDILLLFSPNVFLFLCVFIHVFTGKP